MNFSKVSVIFLYVSNTIPFHCFSCAVFTCNSSVQYRHFSPRGIFLILRIQLCSSPIMQFWGEEGNLHLQKMQTYETHLHKIPNFLGRRVNLKDLIGRCPPTTLPRSSHESCIQLFVLHHIIQLAILILVLNKRISEI